MPAEKTREQEQAIEALTLFHGGWAKVELSDPSGWPAKMGPVFRVTTAGDMPTWLVFEDGSAMSSSLNDYSNHITFDQLMKVVYGNE